MRLHEDIRTLKGKKPEARTKNKIIKLLAAYKVLQIYHPGQESVLIQKNRILNWLGNDSDATSSWFSNVTWKGHPLFVREPYGDFTKFRVNKNFINVMDLRLLEEKPELIQDNYVIYYDIGHGNKNTLMTY